MKNDFISVVIPFYNAESTLPSCLRSLHSQLHKTYQVILVDNNSTDSSSQIAKEFVEKNPDVFSLCRELRQGPSFARNRGAREAKGEIIAFTDADCTADPNWLIQILNAFTGARIAAAAGRILTREVASALDKFHGLFTMPSSAEPQIIREFTLIRGGFPTANLAIRRDIFEKVGGFDEAMEIYSEDYDLCARIYKAGYVISYTPAALIYHKHRNTLRGTWKQSVGFGKGHAVLLRKHFKQLVVIDLPRYLIFSKKVPLRAWFDFRGADKKLFFLLATSLMWWPLLGVFLCYLVYIYWDIRCRLRDNGWKSNVLERCAITLLLLIKSAGITCGRIVGAFKNKVLCL